MWMYRKKNIAVAVVVAFVWEQTEYATNNVQKLQDIREAVSERASET